MNREQRRANAARLGIPHGPTLFRDIGRLVRTAKSRAARTVYDGKVTPESQRLIAALRYLYAVTPEISARVMYSRDIGHHTGGWWKNPDYERCFHLSMSFCVNPTDEPVPFLREPANRIAVAFWGDAARWAWVEKPYSPEGRRADVWHYRLFCDPSWAPILPSGEVYTRSNTPADWRSFSEVHDLSRDEIDAPFLLNQSVKPA